MMGVHRRTKVVLMADDDEDDLLLVRAAFASFGIPVEFHSVTDGEELLEYLFHRNSYQDPSLAPDPTLILLDLNMPRKNGWDALAEIKAHPMLKQIPVVVLTTSRQESHIRRCYEMGASSFVMKPNNYNTLVDVLKTTAKYWLETVELPYCDQFSRPRDERCDSPEVAELEKWSN